MYCPSCGNQATAGLNFCKRCGTNLTQPGSADQPQNISFRVAGMFWAVAVFGICSLTGLLGITIPLVGVGVRSDVLIAIVGAGALSILGIGAMMIWLLARLTGVLQPKSSSEKPRVISVPDYTPAQLPAPPNVVGSITENTTRTLDPARREEERIRG